MKHKRRVQDDVAEYAAKIFYELAGCEKDEDTLHVSNLVKKNGVWRQRGKYVNLEETQE